MGFAGSKLDDFARSATRDRTPRADLGLYLDHDLIRIEDPYLQAGAPRVEWYEVAAMGFNRLPSFYTPDAR